jgi:segregation and condensation protein B
MTEPIPEMDKLENDPTAHWDRDPAARRQRVEAVLFLARGPLTSRRIAQWAGLEDGTQARTLVRQLNQQYDDNGRAFHIKTVAGGYQLLTRPQFSQWIRRLVHVPSRIRMSGPALETLTVVAYRQPIIKADIEAIRGVACGEILRQLLERGLLRICGRREELGRPFLYATTKRFLAEFGLGSLQDLPKAGELSGPGLPGWANSDQISHQNISITAENGAADMDKSI